MGATPQGFESLPLRHLYLHFQGYYRSSVLEAVNKIIYHTAEQLRLLHCDNIQFDTVALLLLTLTHPRRITAIQLRMVSALSSLADIQQIQCIPCRRSAVVAKSCYRKVGYSVCTALWKRQMGIYTADLRLVYQVNKNKSFQPTTKMKIS